MGQLSNYIYIYIYINGIVSKPYNSKGTEMSFFYTFSFPNFYNYPPLNTRTFILSF